MNYRSSTRKPRANHTDGYVATIFCHVSSTCTL